MPLTVQELAYLRARYNEIVVAIKQGELLEVTYVKANRFQRKPGRRNPCGWFTPSSRLRMLKMLSRVHWESVGKSVFITLSYPDVVASREMEQRTQDRHRFFRDMENYLGRKVGALWRVEWVSRKSGNLLGTMVPHVHLLVFGLRFIPYQVVNRLWRGVLGVDGPLRTEVKRAGNEREVAKYAAKYAGKKAESSSLVIASYLNKLGRAWGVHRPSLIPWCERRTDFRMTREEIDLLERAAASKIPYFPIGSRSGFTLFGPIVSQVLEEIRLRRIDKYAQSC